jgi:hypothetical protein
MLADRRLETPMSCVGRAASPARPRDIVSRVVPLLEHRTAHFRAHERRHVQLEGALTYPAGGNEPVGVKVLNIGLAGAGIACHVIVRQEDRVLLTLYSHALLDPLPLAGRVAWVQIPQVGGLVYAGVAFEVPERSQVLTLFQLIGALTF